MCRILTVWDTKFRFCEGKVWRQSITKSNRWKRCDNIVPLSNGYIQIKLTNKEGKVRRFYLNRLVYKAYNPNWNIMDNSKNNFIDHVDGNPLNNHIDNLRVLTNQKNQWNQIKAKGCDYHKQYKKWRSHIKLNNKDIHLGLYNTEEEAHNAYMKIKPYIHNIEDNKYDKLTFDDLSFISTDKMKNKLLNIII